MVIAERAGIDSEEGRRNCFDELASNHVANTQSTETTPSEVYDVYSAQGIKLRTLFHILPAIVVVTSRKPHLPIKSFPAFNCGKRGHLAKAYRDLPSARTNKGFKQRNPFLPTAKIGKEQSTHLVDKMSDGEDVYVDTMYHIQGEHSKLMKSPLQFSMSRTSLILTLV